MKSENNNIILGSGSRLPVAAQPSSDTTTIQCPECGSQRLWKNGMRYEPYGEIQRYLCRNCFYRFSITEGSEHSERVQRLQTLFLKSKVDKDIRCLVGATQTRGAKNLAETEARTQEKAAGATGTQPLDVKGKIIEYLWWMEKQGYSKETIRGYGSCLRALQTRNADLLDQETVKEALAREKKWSQNRRRNAINAYTLFLKVNRQYWDKPRCTVTRKIPFIPTEQEIDSLIAGCSNKVATFLELLKQTAMRSGEAKRLLWTDIDFDRRIIILNEPEKNGNPRMWNNVNPKLMNMLNALPRKSLKVFGDGPINSTKTTFLKARRRLAVKLQNPRLDQIHFHTLRHWKATMEYHRTKDLLHTMAFLGHKKSDNTLLYIQLDQKLFKEGDDTFMTRIAHNAQEACGLIEVGFDYITGEYNDGGKIFRKRK